MLLSTMANHSFNLSFLKCDRRININLGSALVTQRISNHFGFKYEPCFKNEKIKQNKKIPETMTFIHLFT